MKIKLEMKQQGASIKGVLIGVFGSAFSAANHHLQRCVSVMVENRVHPGKLCDLLFIHVLSCSVTMTGKKPLHCEFLLQDCRHNQPRKKQKQLTTPASTPQ